MRITAFNIERFGIFSHVSCDNLSPQINIFFGPNEAGKSTCLEFFRIMLTGSSGQEDAESRFAASAKNAKDIGCIDLYCDDAPRDLTICRSAFWAGGSRIFSKTDSAAQSEVLWKIFQERLGGIDNASYRKIFGFSLSELQKWNRRNIGGIYNELVAASFGPGLNNPGDALKRLNKDMEYLCGGRGKHGQIHREFEKLEELDRQVSAKYEENASFDILSLELSTLDNEREELKRKVIDLRQERANVERRLLNWDLWQKWKTLSSQLSALPAVPPDFPSDAANRLSALTASVQSREQSISSAKVKLRQLRNRRDEIEVDAELLANLGNIRDLAQRRFDYETTRANLPLLEEKCGRIEKDLQDNLDQLGSDWSCERIRKLDRSLFAREDMEKIAAEMTEAQLGSQVAANTLAVVTRETEHIRQNLTRDENNLCDLPEPPAVLSGDERDSLRQKMEQLERDRRMIESRAKALAASNRMYERALNQTQLFLPGDKSAYETKASILKNILDNQIRARDIAESLQTKLLENENMQRQISQTSIAADRLKTRIEEIQSGSGENASDRENLDSKIKALRALRNIYANTEKEEENKRELDARIAQEKKPRSLRNWAVIICSLLFIAAAVVIFIAHWVFGIYQFEFGSGMTLPINLWAAYVALLCGVVLLGSGFSGQGPEKKRQKEELSKLLAKSESSSMRLAELASQSQTLCQTVGMENLDTVALDAMEMLLERKKEQLFKDEQARKTADSFEKDLAEINAELAKLRGESAQFTSSAQQCRRQWHALMQSMNLASIPSPESAETLFARVEAALIAYENVLDTQNEIQALEGAVKDTEAELAQMPFVAAYRNGAGQPLELEAAIIQILEMCAEADAIREKRKSIQARIDNGLNDLKLAQTRQAQAESEMQSRKEVLEAASAKWSARISSLGLQADLKPETVREAYACMRKCLEDEERLAQTKLEIENGRQMLSSLCKALDNILPAADLDVGGIGEEAWTTVISRLQEQAEKNRRGADRKEILEEEIKTREEEIEALEAALARAVRSRNEFVAKGRAANVEEFLQTAAIYEKRIELEDREKEIRGIIAEALPNTDLDSFLSSFEENDQPELKNHLESMDGELSATQARLEQIAGQIASLRERIGILEKNDDTTLLIQKKAIQSEKVSRLLYEWQCQAMANGLITSARQSYENGRQPQIMRKAAEIFSDITGGHWAGLRLNLENAEVMATGQDGACVAPANLSRGAREQIYLSIRLAYISRHASGHESLPIIMDEILVNFDPERARRTARALGNMAANDRQQFLYFTCQPQMVDMLRESFDESKLFLVDNGAIRAA